MSLLNEGLEKGRRVILVSAPAGFGKTTSIVEWLNDRKDAYSAWITLDPVDDDPIRFLWLLTAALRRIDEGMVSSLVQSLKSGSIPPAERVVEAIINDTLTYGREITIVLDDLHVLNDENSWKMVAGLVNAAPRLLELVLITREDPPVPLARLRAHNLLTEVRASHLRFSDEESLEFLAGSSIPALDRDSIDLLLRKNEGWIVGIQLTVLSMRESSSPSGFISNLHGSQLYFFQYLTEQILNNQSEDVRRFLLETSILDKLAEGLCNALTGRSDGGIMLNRLAAKNMFLIQLDDSGRLYRYHHLFADLLRTFQRELGDRKLRELHGSAAAWFVANHFPVEALRHAIAADDQTLTVRLLEEYAFDLVMDGFAQTVRGFIQKIPAQWAAAAYRTNLALVWICLLNGEYEKARYYLKKSLDAEEMNEPAAPEYSIMQSFLAATGEDALSFAQAAVASLDEVTGNNERVRALAQLSLAYAYSRTENTPRAIKSYRLAMTLGRSSAAPGVEAMAGISLSSLLLENGNIGRAYDTALLISDRSGVVLAPPPYYGLIYGMLGEVALLRADLSAARSYCARAYELCVQGGYRSGIIGCSVNLARIARHSGDTDEALRCIRLATENAREMTPGYVRAELVVEAVALQLALGHFDAARDLLEEAGISFGEQGTGSGISPQTGATYPSLLQNISLLRYFLGAGREQVFREMEKAIQLAGSCIEKAESAGKKLVRIEALLLRAQLKSLSGESGDRDGVLADYIEALSLSREHEPLILFLEYRRAVDSALSSLLARRMVEGRNADLARRIIERCRADLSSASADGSAGQKLGSILTGRETEVIRLMASGLKYEEIADAMYVSLNTVRFHVKSIYGKLGVENKTQALMRARDLGILK